MYQCIINSFSYVIPTYCSVLLYIHIILQFFHTAIISFVYSTVALCTQGCYNGGTCTSPEMCSCSAGWTGNDCRTGNSVFK